MEKFDVKIRVSADNETQVREIAGLLQNTLNVVENTDLVRLLKKVISNPKIVKTALKFI